MIGTSLEHDLEGLYRMQRAAGEFADSMARIEKVLSTTPEEARRLAERVRNTMAPVAADVHFWPLDGRGDEILDELEKRTEVLPYLQSETERAYALLATKAELDGFDAMLDEIDPDWRDHLRRTGQ